MLLIFRSVLAVALVTPLVAQAGNEVVMLSGGGAAAHFAWSGSGNWLSLPTIAVMGLSDSVWTDGGRTIYAARFAAGGSISHGSWDGAAATFSTLWTAPGACYGIGLDRNRQLLYTLIGPPGTAAYRELYCLDVNPASPNYGGFIMQSTTLDNYMRERWALSPSGNFAVVPHTWPSSGLCEIVDTDLTSPTFLQVVQSVPCWGAASLGIVMTADCAMSPDDQFAYQLYAGASGGSFGVLHLPTSTWLDFDAAPGYQEIATPFTPVQFDLAPDGSFAVIVGDSTAPGASTAGWALRVEFDYVNPHLSTTQYLSPGPGVLTGASSVAVSPTGDRVAIGCNGVAGGIRLLDVATGALLQSYTINVGGARTVAWQDSSPTATYDGFGSGCPGTLATPSLQAFANTRPALGTPFWIQVSQLPNNAALLATGLSDTTWGGQLLPLDLAGVGAPGCSWLVESLSFLLVTAPLRPRRRPPSVLCSRCS